MIRKGQVHASERERGMRVEPPCRQKSAAADTKSALDVICSRCDGSAPIRRSFPGSGTKFHERWEKSSIQNAVRDNNVLHPFPSPRIVFATAAPACAPLVHAASTPGPAAKSPHAPNPSAGSHANAAPPHPRFGNACPQR